MGKALEILGYNQHLSSSLALTKDWYEGNYDPIMELARKHDAFEDWPWPLLYQEFYREFDNAKFILTIRESPEIWHHSLSSHATRTGPTEYRKMIYGHEMPHNFVKEDIEFYNKHNEQVIQFFKENDPSKLLVVCWERGDGWNQLCSFLNKTVPNKKFPFHNDSSKESAISIRLRRSINKQLKKVSQIINPNS